MLSKDTIGLFETDAQLSALLEWRERTGEAIEPVALTPLADHAAARRGVACATIEDHLDEGETMARGVALIPRLEAFCSWLDAEMAAAMPEADAPAWFSARDHIYSLKICFDGIFHRTAALSALIEARRPGRIVGFRPFLRQGHPVDASNWVAWRSTALAALPLVAAARGVETALLPNPDPPLPAYGEPPARPDLWDGLTRQLEAFMAGRPDRPRVIVLGRYWSGMDGVTAAQRRGLPLVRLDVLLGPHDPVPAERRERFDRLWDLVARSEAWRRLFAFDGVDARPLAAPIFETLVRRTAPWQEAAVTRLAERLRHLGDAVLLTSSVVVNDNVVALRAARLAGIPSVLLQHGGLWYFRSPMAHYAELLLPDYYLCYGEGSAAAIRALDGWHPRPPGDPCARPVPAGCRKTFLTQRREPAPLPIPADRPVRVLHISTALSGEGYYLSANRHADIRYWRLMRDAVAHCAGLPGVALTVRPGLGVDADNPFRAWLADSGAPCRLAADGPLEPLLEEADVIVIDYVSSVLLQVAATGAQVVALLWEEPIVVLEPGVEEALGRRAWVARNREAFLDAITAAIEAVRTGVGARPLDDAFLTLYAGDPTRDPAETVAGLLAALSPVPRPASG